MSQLWYEKPAAEWEEALPVGNGRLGGMIYGGVDRELLQVNEESMWFGGAVNRHNPDMRRNLPLIRDYLDKGEIHKAERLMETAMSGCPDSMHAYQTLGEIHFFFDGLKNARERKSNKIGKLELCPGTEDFERSLNLEDAVGRVSFRCGNTVYRREYFASHPADCLVMRFWSQGQESLSFQAGLRRGKWFDGVRKTGDNGILLYGNLGRGGCEFAMELRARAVGGRVYTVGEVLKVEDAKEVELFFTADTTNQYSGEEKDAWVRAYQAQEHTLPEGLTEELSETERLEYSYQAALQAFLAERLEEKICRAMEKSYAELLEEHRRDYAGLYGRFAFCLEGAEKYDSVPTDIRLQNARKGKADPGLSKMLFDFGRYLTIAGSRKEGLPTTLQGLWNKEFFPPWDSKYTININTEMNYWHVEECNLSECHLPLFRLLEKVRRNGRYTASQMYGCRGFVAHHNTDIHGDTAPQDVWYPGSYWTMGGAWLSTHLWKHYQYTRDREFLEKAFPIMAEAALFFVDFLVEKDGYLVTSPSVSPENTYILPGGEKGACCIGATMDNQILRDLFDCCRRAWEALDERVPEGCHIEGVESIPGLMEEIAACRSRLMPERISDSGRIMEWMEDYEEADPGHRHISHLYGLYPAGQITVEETPELAAAAERTLEYRLAHGGGHTGWSRAWIMNHYVSLRNAEKAYESIERMLELSTYPNLFDCHPPFQIDGNFGACAAMSRMLAQSSEEWLVLLPALPEAWRTGSVRGLRLVGNAELSLTWADGRLLKADIRADSDYDTTVIYRERHVPVSLRAGEEIELRGL